MPISDDPGRDQGVHMVDPAAFTDLQHEGAAATKANEPAWARGRGRSSSTHSSNSLVITLNSDFTRW